MEELKIQSIIRSPSHPLEKVKKEETKESFAQILQNSIQEVNQLQKEADKSVKGLLSGENKGIHETMIALEKADISFQLMMQIRNKILDAYQEMMRTQV